MNEPPPSIVTVLAWVNPAIGRAIFLQTADRPQCARAKVGDGSKVAVTIPVILLAASHDTFTGVITLAVARIKTDLPVTALVAIAVIIVVTCSGMLPLAFLGGHKQVGLFRDTVTRFMGLIVGAMGVQFARTRYKSFMS